MNVTVHDGTGSYEGIFPMVAPHTIVALAPRVARHGGRRSGGTHPCGDRAARVVYVGEYGTGTAEHVVLQCHRIVNADVVLDLTLLPIWTSLPTKTFWPKEQRFRRCERHCIYVPSARSAFRRLSALRDPRPWDVSSIQLRLSLCNSGFQASRGKPPGMAATSRPSTNEGMPESISITHHRSRSDRVHGLDAMPGVLQAISPPCQDLLVAGGVQISKAFRTPAFHRSRRCCGRWASCP